MSNTQGGAGGELSPVRNWRPPRPQELPELRGRLACWLAGTGPLFYRHMVLAGKQGMRPPGRPAESAATLAAEERHRVVSGDLYWASEEMTELAVHSGKQLERGELYLADLPSRAGFMVFGTPIARYTQTGMTAEIVAVSWGIVRTALAFDVAGLAVPLGCSRAPDSAVWVTFYTDPDWFLATNFADKPDFVAVQRSHMNAPFLPDNELVWPFGLLVDPWPEDKGTVVDWARTVCAAWLLMAQPLASEQREPSRKPARRRLARWGVPDRDVRVVHVRRPERHQAEAPGEMESSRTYECQWWVTGHWRRYHVGPGRTQVRRRYITPYIAGPADKPLRGTDRVRVWDR